MQGIKKNISELSAMLKIAEVDMKNKHQVLMVSKTTSFKMKGKKGVPKNGSKNAAPIKKHKFGPKFESECFYYKAMGHWKRNCPKYIANKKILLIGNHQSIGKQLHTILA
jgi:hypothetical protein